MYITQRKKCPPAPPHPQRTKETASGMPRDATGCHDEKELQAGQPGRVTGSGTLLKNKPNQRLCTKILESVDLQECI
ncbi:hypothetical protein KGM_209899 [Danaus plexippus plexippus]|uniref:Uncharacterized protein n=1 Tax=Danaus plexippus plexippus TaxID=278856 RepID=A0A212EJY8_DANPL|nr:hypothetical protein KGM_209899 [Danaus plexippus plexippus]